MSEIDLGIEGLADIETIGRGGSAAVYRARQVALDRVVAVKVLMSAWDVDVRRRFDRECRSMGKLSDDLGVVPIYESGETSTGAPYIVMPYYPAGSLQDEMNRNGAFGWRNAARHIKVVAETIAGANESGVVHRDIKPANLLLGNDDKPRVSDFGIARLIADEQLANHPSTPLFTPAYCSPESFSENSVDPTVDVYGLGSTFWALLAGHSPFKSKGEKVDMITVFSRVANDPIGDLRHLAPDSICSLIERTVAKSPSGRPQDAREFLAELAVAANEAESAPFAATSATIPLAESTISLSRPAENDQAVGPLAAKPGSAMTVLPPSRPVKRERESSAAGTARLHDKRSTLSNQPERTGIVAFFKGPFWLAHSTKFLIGGVAALVVATTLAALSLPIGAGNSEVAGTKVENSEGGEGNVPQIIGLSTNEVSNNSVTLTFSTNVCTIVSLGGPGLETAQTQGWPDDFSKCSTNHQQTFADLTEGQVYAVSVEAKGVNTEIATGLIQFTAGFDSLEEAPTVTTTKSSATITFATSTCTVVEFTGENLTRFAEQGWPDANNSCSETHEHTFADLEPETSYTVQVTILDREDRRTKVPVHFTTDSGGFAISDFRVSNVSGTQATVSFSTNRCSDARFFGSAGSYFEDGWTNRSARCSTKHTHTYSALKPGTNYSVEVEARDDNGSETVRSSKPLSFNTRTDEKVEIAGVDVSDITSTSVTVEVTTTVCSAVEITIGQDAYVSGAFAKPTPAGCLEKHSVKVSSLTPGTSYPLSVVAKSISNDVSRASTLEFETGSTTAPMVVSVTATVDDQSVTVRFAYDDCAAFSVALVPAGDQAAQTGACDATGTGSVTFATVPTGTYEAVVTVVAGDEEDSASASFEIVSIDG